MNNPELIVMLTIGMCLMCGIIALQMGWYIIPKWKCIFISFALILTGLYGSRFWYYIENGSFRGRSFYGVIFLAPVVFFVVSKLLKIKYDHTMDFVAPGGCLTLALVKIQCLRDGCCEGMILYIDENRNYVRFPSQQLEMAIFLVIFVILLYLSSKPKMRGKIFPWFLVLYGGSRFFLDFLRDTEPSYLFGLSAGSFWSAIAFIIGIVVLCYLRLSKKGEKNDY